MKPALALSMVVSPMQMDVGAFAAMTGSPTETVLLTVSLQPFASVAVRVYVVVTVGLACGFEEVLELSPPAGFHRYDTNPGVLANVALLPMQMYGFPGEVSDKLFTVTVVEVLSEQLLLSIASNCTEVVVVGLTVSVAEFTPTTEPEAVQV
jgi:hypothetical protein